ncbi:hypothetical protein KZ843_16315, partial [Pseudomonas aeruginosa]
DRDQPGGRHAQLFCRDGRLGRRHRKALVGLTLVFGSIAPQTPLFYLIYLLLTGFTSIKFSM